ncbi:MAG: hypothetical protein JWO36_3329 [Myxococcales bacterium]|nr:hypothetical protein [Myxococcales bacterium]
MKKRLLLIAMLAGCGNAAVVNDAHIIVDGYNSITSDCRGDVCSHNENTDLTVFGGATYLVHRTAESQVLGPNSSLRVYRSDDHGATWKLLAIMPAINGRDLRDPCFYTVNGQLAIKALTRLPVTSDRDSNVDTIAVATISPDAGATWSPLAPIGPNTWSFWRIKDRDQHYNAAYEDGDKSVRLFSSIDGTTWTMGPLIYDVAADTPLETELVFMPSGKLLAIVRMDGTNDELLGSTGRLRTALCWSDPPYASFACPQILDGVRLDGPIAFFHDSRLFVVARKHILGVANRKRTALYELTGDFDHGGELTIVEHTELPSTGDTSYAGVAPIDNDRVLVTWYSSVLAQDGPWARALLGPTDIWQAQLDLSAL